MIGLNRYVSWTQLCMGYNVYLRRFLFRSCLFWPHDIANALKKRHIGHFCPLGEHGRVKTLLDIGRPYNYGTPRKGITKIGPVVLVGQYCPLTKHDRVKSIHVMNSTMYGLQRLVKTFPCQRSYFLTSWCVLKKWHVSHFSHLGEHGRVKTLLDIGRPCN